MKLGEYEFNNIYNEDSYKAIKKIPDKSIDLIYTDIPYLVKNMVSGTGNIKVLKGFTKDSEERKETRRKTFLELGEIMNGIDYSILDDFCRVMKNIYIYIWCSKEQILDLMKYFVDEKGCLFEILVWCKTNPTPFCNNTFLPDLEYCLLFKERGCKLNDGYELKSKWYVSQTNVSDKALFYHPTIKPLELVKRHILHSTAEGDIIADFFLGSGTTCVASKELKRNYIGFENKEKYFKIAKKRLNNETANGQFMLDLFS